MRRRSHICKSYHSYAHANFKCKKHYQKWNTSENVSPRQGRKQATNTGARMGWEFLKISKCFHMFCAQILLCTQINKNILTHIPKMPTYARHFTRTVVPTLSNKINGKQWAAAHFYDLPLPVCLWPWLRGNCGSKVGSHKRYLILHLERIAPHDTDGFPFSNWNKSDGSRNSQPQVIRFFTQENVLLLFVVVCGVFGWNYPLVNFL